MIHLNESLKSKSFGDESDLCNFINTYKVEVEQICVMHNIFYLFYWEI